MDTKMTRRNFVALSGAAAVAAAGASVAVAEEAASEAADEQTAAPADGETLEADVVIAGAGAAGMWAAIEVCRAGKSVIVVEKGASTGMSNGAIAGGPFVVESSAQKEAGIDITVDIAFNHMMDWAHWSICAPVVKKCLELSGETVDQFTSEFGIPTYMRPDNYGRRAMTRCASASARPRRASRARTAGCPCRTGARRTAPSSSWTAPWSRSSSRTAPSWA